VQILHAAGKHGGLNSKLTADGFGDVKDQFLKLIVYTNEWDRDMLKKTTALVTEYNISRGGRARCATYRHRTLLLFVSTNTCVLSRFGASTPHALYPPPPTSS
jgi:hypothetical protein